jgi:flagellar protein FlgJ
MSIDTVGTARLNLPAGDEARLRQAANDLQGVFVAELFKAMRETVPQDGIVNGGAGEDMFSGMMDQHLAPQAGEGWGRGLGEALYRQLRDRLVSPSNGEEPSK